MERSVLDRFSNMFENHLEPREKILDAANLRRTTNYPNIDDQFRLKTTKAK